MFRRLLGLPPNFSGPRLFGYQSSHNEPALSKDLGPECAISDALADDDDTTSEDVSDLSTDAESVSRLGQTPSRLLTSAAAIKCLIEPLTRQSRLSLPTPTKRDLRDAALRTCDILDALIMFAQFAGDPLWSRVDEVLSAPFVHHLEELLSATEALRTALTAHHKHRTGPVLRILTMFVESYSWVGTAGRVASVVQSAIDTEDNRDNKTGSNGHADTSATDESLMCPLERVMKAAVPRQQSSYELSDFVDWAARETAESHINALIGPMQSAHLFRSRSAPLHHEFALIRFGGLGVAESWIRVERAAREKAAGLLPQADSFGPLLNGVRLRESISFGCTKEDLSQNADELARVTISADRDAYNRVAVEGHLYLSEIATQLNETTDADPLYQLFSANCRWFARRTVLSVAQRLSAINTLGAIAWRNRPVDLDSLSKHVLNDWFGGRQLAGDRAREIKAANLLHITRTTLARLDYRGALEPGLNALDLLEQIKRPSRAQLTLTYLSCWYIGIGLVECDRDVEALPLLERARSIVTGSSMATSSLLMDETYAKCLSKLDRDDEAITVRTDIIERRRHELLAGEGRVSTLETLGNSLKAHSLHLWGLHRAEDALVYAPEGVAIWRQLTERRPDLHQNSLGAALDILSSILSDLGQDEQALAAAEESIAVTREAYKRLPGQHRYALASRFLRLIEARRAIGDSDGALEGAQESANLFRSLHQAEPQFHHLEYGFSLIVWANELVSADRNHEAAEVFNSAWELSSEETSFDGKRNKMDLRRFRILERAAAGLLALNDPRCLPSLRQTLNSSHQLSGDSARSNISLADILLNIALASPYPFSQDANALWCREVLHLGCDFIATVKRLLERVPDNEDGDELNRLRMEVGLAQSNVALSACQLALGAPAESLLSLSQALEKASTFMPADPESLSSLEHALAQCSVSLRKVFCFEPADSVADCVPHSRRLLALWQELLDRCPLPAKHQSSLCEATWGHAEWAVGKLNEVDDVRYFHDAIDFARRFTGRDDDGTMAQSVLLKALYSYAAFLTRQNSTGNARSILLLLDEAFPILNNLLQHDRTDYVEMSLPIAGTYSSILSAVGRFDDALAPSTLRLESARFLYIHDQSPERLSTLSDALATHSGVLNHLNETEAAHDACTEAITIARQLCAIDLDRYRSRLATSLNNAAAILHILGRADDSTEAAIEAMVHFRVMVQNQSATAKHASSFAALLRGLQMAVDEDPDSLLSRKAAVALAETLYDLQSDSSRVVSSEAERDLADAHYRFALKLGEEGELEEAVREGRKAVVILRRLSSEDGGSVSSNLAAALENLAIDLLHSGQKEEAISPLEECTLLRRALHESDDTGSYLPQLAQILDIHARALLELDRSQDAVVLSGEALSLRRRFFEFEAGEERARAALFRSLETHRLCETRLGHETESCLLAREAELLGQGETSMDILWRQQAYDAASECLELQRALYLSEPSSQLRDDLCEALIAYASAAESRGGPEMEEEVFGVGNEVLELTRTEYESNPTREGFARRVVYLYHLHAEWCLQTGRTGDALRIKRELISILRPRDNDPTSSGKEEMKRLASALESLIVLLLDLDRKADVLEPLTEVIPLLEELCIDDPETFEEKLAGCLRALPTILGQGESSMDGNACPGAQSAGECSGGETDSDVRTRMESMNLNND